MKPIDELKELLDSGQFHHATIRNEYKVWDGIWFYRKADDGHRGFAVGGCVFKDDPDFESALELVRHTGVSVGAFGEG